MQCATCKSEISSEFKHAIAVNECPACGGQLIDEETMALIDDVEKTISSEVTLREGTAQKLSMIIVTKYNLSMDNTNIQDNTAPQQREHKIAPPSTAQKMEQKNSQKSAQIINVSELDDDENISEEERSQIMESVIREKFNMVDQTVFTEENKTGVVEEVRGKPVSKETKQMTQALFGGSDNFLEEERMLRLAKQQQVLNSGGGSIRRSS